MRLFELLLLLFQLPPSRKASAFAAAATADEMADRIPHFSLSIHCPAVGYPMCQPNRRIF
jgi:hypothetical protein